MKKALFSPLQVSLYTVGCLYASSSITQAQVTTDGTVNTIVTPNGNISEITGGETRGSNLFHSFQDFSVGTGNEAFFNNGDNISNIFSRVTGGNISNINGLIRANDASLFLINPAGILFGAGARLDLGAGSFYGSSASSILFDEGEFSAVDNLEQPVLTVNAPIGLNFRDNPGDITVRGDGNGAIRIDSEGINTQDALRVDSNATIGLLGGNVLFEDATIKTAGGGIEIGSVAEGIVKLDKVDNRFNFDYSGIGNFRDITLSGSSIIDASGLANGLGGGQINVSGNNISISSFSGFTSLTFGSNPGEDINIFAQGSLDISGTEDETIFVGGIFSQTRPSSTADAGSININANSLNMNNNARLTTRNEGQGNAGNVTLAINDSVLISDSANINTQTTGTGEGNAGNVRITTNTLELLRGANIAVNNKKLGDLGSGNSGNINIEARERVSLSQSNLSATINNDPVTNTVTIGDVGNIAIKSPQVSLTNNAVISVSNSGVGKIGNIIIDSPEISVDNFSLITASSRSDSGNNSEGSGNITLNSEQVTLSNGGIIDVTTANQTDGGQININSQVLEISSGGVLQTATEGIGNAGSINLNISDRITIDGNNAPNQPEELKMFDIDGIDGKDVIFFDAILNNLEGTTGILANAQGSDTNTNVGNAGEISINSNTFKLDNNAKLLARYTGQEKEKNGGNITLDIADSLVIDNGANINVEVPEGAVGNAGNIDITANTFELLGQSSSDKTSIIAPNDGQGNSGNISIKANESVLLSNSIISSTITDNAVGNSGNILIESPQVSFTNNATVSVSSEGNGLGGEIKINSDVISVDNFSLIAASSRTNDSSGSGNITLNGKLITLSNGGVINATTASDDNAGEININAEVLEIFSGGVLQTATEGNGNAGNINLNISNRIELNGNDAPDRPSEFDFEDNILNTLEGKTGIFSGNETTPSTGGNINIDTKFIVAFPKGNSDILANSQQGAGGEIKINAESVFGITEGAASIGINSNDIDASGDIEDGSVEISTSGINPIQGATELPSNIVTPEQTTAQACQANRKVAAQNGFTIKGKGGIPNDPGLPLDSQNVSINGETNSISTIPQPIETSQGKIQPARGIKVTEDGGIMLTVYRTNNAGDRIPHNSQNCDRV